MGNFAAGDYVRYGINGICMVSSVSKMSMSGSGKKTEYYVLKPISNQTTTLYVPADNEKLTSKMDRILSKAELDNLIVDSDSSNTLWIDDRKQRGEVFNNILKKCDQQELLKLLSCMYLKKLELGEIGKSLSATDDGLMKKAERLIQSDFSFVLGIPETEVGEYIRSLIAAEK